MITNRKKTLHKTGSSTVTYIALKREEIKRKKKKLLQHGVFVFGNPSKQETRRTGLTFAEQTRRGAVLVLFWCYNSTFDIFFLIFKISQNVTNKEKKSLLSPGKIKNEKKKKRIENENPIMLALLIGQEAVLSFLFCFFFLSRTRITNNFMNVFNGVTSLRVVSYRCVLPVAFNLNLS